MKEYLHHAVASALASLHYPAADIFFEKPKIAAHGDLTTNVAMVIAKSAGQNPRQIAQAIVGAMNVDPARISSTEIAGPGFINFHFTDSYVIDSAKAILQHGANFGRSACCRRTQDECRMGERQPYRSSAQRAWASGHSGSYDCQSPGVDRTRVTREYYFNNAGNQMRTLAESVYARYRQSLGDDYPFPSEGYQGEYIRYCPGN